MLDLKSRCRGPCGWAGLQDVRTGERQDRMESFWLSETWKYLFLLFDEDNPLHKLDAPWVFTTEGHPIILPAVPSTGLHTNTTNPGASFVPAPARTCVKPPASSGFFSNTASRADLFHAAYFTQLHLTAPPSSPAAPFFPYTLPAHLVPPNATCAPLPEPAAFELHFPAGFAAPRAPRTLRARLGPRTLRVADGIRILSLDALRLSLRGAPDAPAVRVARVAGVAVARGDVVYVDRALVAGLRDANFEIVAHPARADLVLDDGGVVHDLLARLGLAAALPARVPATAARGAGALPARDLRAASVYDARSDACVHMLDAVAEVVVVRRGGCSFAEKIANVPDTPEVRLVVVENYDGGEMVAPVLDGAQQDARGRARANQVALVMVERGVRWGEVRAVEVRQHMGVRIGGREVLGVEVT